VKNGSERVAQQCRDNIFSIQTLKDFQFIDKDGKDQGVNGSYDGSHVTRVVDVLLQYERRPKS